MSEVILNKILTEITGIKHELKEFKRDTSQNLASVKQDLANFKLDTKQNFDAVKQDLADFKLDTKQNFDAIKQEQAITNDRLSSLETKQEIIYNQTGKLTESHSEMISLLKNLASKDDIDYLDKKIGEHDREIYKIKNQF